MSVPESAERSTLSVLFITRAYPPVKGGMEQFSYDLTTAIAARARTHIIANRYGKAFLPLFLVMAFFRAWRRIREYEILHLGDPVLSLLGGMLRRLRPLPTAMTVHGLDIMYPSPFYQRYLQRFFASADLYICISAYVEQLLKAKFGIKRTVVIPPGIRDTLYRPAVTREDVARAIGRDLGTETLLLSVGHLVPRKGVAWFIGNVLPRLPNTLYIVVGSGSERSHIEEEAKRHGTDNRVVLMGAMNDDELRTVYNGVDIFVMPNVLIDNDPEGFGLVALEAASCGRPVIASAIQGIVDAIYDGRNGVLVEAEDAPAFAEHIQRFAADPALRTSFGAQARAFTLQRFSWNVIAQKYLEAFELLRRL